MINRLRFKDKHLKESLTGAALAILLRGLGAGLAFALNAMIGRLLGVEGTGLYFLALSVAMIAAVIARMGLDNALLRFVAVNATKQDWGRVGGVFNLGMRMALISSAILTVLSFILAPWLADTLFGKPDLGIPLRWMSLAIMSFSLMMLLSECLKGLRRIRNSMLVSGVLYPLLGILFIWPLVKIFGVSGASMTFVLATGMAAALGLIYWRRALALHGSPATPFPRNELVASSRPLWVMAVINQAILPWVPLFLLGVWGATEEVGIFGAATRISLLISIFLMAVNTILSPKFAELYSKGEIATLSHISRRFALLTTLMASPFLFFLIFQGNMVMGVFGDGFEVGGDVLAILVIGQAINTVTGSVGYLLIMSGHEKDARNSSVMASIIMLVLALALIPEMKMTGAAIASSAAIAASNIFSLYFVWKRLGIINLPFVPSKI